MPLRFGGLDTQRKGPDEMIRIDIDDASVNVRSGTNTRGPWQSREQTAWVHLFERNGTPQPHPQRMIVRLDDDQQPYPVGKYQLADNSFYLGDFGRLTLYPRLVALAAAAQPIRQAA